MLKKLTLCILFILALSEQVVAQTYPSPTYNNITIQSKTGYLKCNGSSPCTAAATVPLTDIAPQASNTIPANATAGSAAPTALAIPSCSTASSALNWTTSGGASAFTCNTSIAANTSITANAVPAANLTGTALASGVTTFAGGLLIVNPSGAGGGATGNAQIYATPTLTSGGLGVGNNSAVFVWPVIGAMTVNTGFVSTYNMKWGDSGTEVPAGTLSNLEGYECNITTKQISTDTSEGNHCFGGTIQSINGGTNRGISITGQVTTVAGVMEGVVLNLTSSVSGSTLVAYTADSTGSAFPATTALNVTGSWANAVVFGDAKLYQPTPGSNPTIMQADGYTSRSGTAGSYGGNFINSYWNSSCLQAWVDTTDLGCTRTVSTTAPTIVSGFGTSPAIATSPQSYAFKITVGTGGAASSGVIGFPTGITTVGWSCNGNDITTQSTTVFSLKQTGNNATQAGIANYTTAGIAGAWVAGDILLISCEPI